MKVMKLLKFQLFHHRKHILIWSGVVGGILLMYMILFPYIQEMGLAKIEAFGEEILKMFGMDGFTEFTNFVMYYGVMLRMVSIAITIFSILFMGNLIFKEEREKTIEQFTNLPISRKELWLSKLLLGLLSIFIVSFSGFITTTLAGLINGGDTYVFIDTLKIYLLLSLIPMLFGLVSFSLASITTKYAMPGIATGLFLILYFIGYIGNLLEDKGLLLTYFSPFEHLIATNALNPTLDLFILVGLYVLGVGILTAFGYYRYQKRDYIL